MGQKWDSLGGRSSPHPENLSVLWFGIVFVLVVELLNKIKV